MKIEITEEERQFLERVCVREKLFISMKLFDKNHIPINPEKDIDRIECLINKFRSEK